MQFLARTKIVNRKTSAANAPESNYRFANTTEVIMLINHIKLNPEVFAESMYISKRTVAGNLYLVREKQKNEQN